MRIMLDLNVIADVVQKREPHYTASARALSLTLNKRHTAYVSAHALTTLFYITEKHRNRQLAEAVVDWMLAHFEVGSPTKEDFLRARTTAFPDFEDAVVDSVAVSCKCDLTLTRNQADFKKAKVPAMTPEHFVAEYG